jgi:hypothetical protein
MLKIFKQNDLLPGGVINKEGFIFCYTFTQLFKKSLLNKHVLLEKSTSCVSHQGVISSTFFIFYRTKLNSQYRFSFFSGRGRKGTLSYTATKTPPFFCSFNKRSRFSLISFIVLNCLVRSNTLMLFFSFFTRFRTLLFLRKTNLYFDGIKIISMFSQTFIPINLFIFFLSELFSMTVKKKHTVYFFFIKFIFQQIVSNSNGYIKGIKLVVSGKLLGKPRSSTHTVSVGSVSLQTIQNRLYFKKSSAYTLVGAFGFKLWISI